MLLKCLAAIIGAFNLANGLVMLLWPTDWFRIAPGAAATGPYNVHFVTDIALAYLAGGIAFLAMAWRPSWSLLALGASGFLVFHALLHLTHAVVGHGAGADILVAIPAFAGLALCWPWRENAA